MLDWFSRRFVAEESETDVLKSFEVFDRDGNGLISIVELRHVLTGLGDRLDGEQVEELLRSADQASNCLFSFWIAHSQKNQGDGMVQYSAFVATMMANQKRY